MKMTAIVVAFLALASVPNTQQASSEYLINATLFVANPQVPGSLQVLGKPLLRTVSGRAAMMTLGEEKGSISVDVTPSDLGAGKAGLHVVAETRHSGQVATATFDLLTGTGTAPATIVLRDKTGAFMLLDGRPLFVSFEATQSR